MDMAKLSSMISHVGLRVTFVKRIRDETFKTKDSDAKVSMRVR